MEDMERNQHRLEKVVEQKVGATPKCTMRNRVLRVRELTHGEGPIKMAVFPADAGRRAGEHYGCNRFPPWETRDRARNICHSPVLLLAPERRRAP